MKTENKKKHYTYILRCSDGTYYTGYTDHLERRVKVHNEGKGAKYTRGRLPVELIYYEEFETKTDAMKREWKLKQLDRRSKEQLISEKKELLYVGKNL